MIVDQDFLKRATRSKILDFTETVGSIIESCPNPDGNFLKETIRIVSNSYRECGREIWPSDLGETFAASYLHGVCLGESATEQDMREIAFEHQFDSSIWKCALQSLLSIISEFADYGYNGSEVWPFVLQFGKFSGLDIAPRDSAVINFFERAVASSVQLPDDKAKWERQLLLGQIRELGWDDEFIQTHDLFGSLLKL